jgi:hypothetical protein
VNTIWVVPAALAYDARNLSRLLSDIVGFSTKILTTVKNEKEYVVLIGNLKLRRSLNETPYGIRNAQLFEMG